MRNATLKWARMAWLALGAVTAASGCAGLRTTRVRFDPQVGENHRESLALDGLAINCDAPHAVTAFFVEDRTDGKVLEAHTVQMLPLEDEIYVVGYRGAIFTDRTMTVVLNPDSTLSQFSFQSTSTAAQDLGSIANALNGAAAPVQSLSSAMPDSVDAQNAQLQKMVLNLQLRANQSALENGNNALPFPSPK